MSAVEQQQNTPAPAPATSHKPEQFTQLSAPSGAGGDAAPAPAPGCLPRFGAVRFQSPRLYFASLTPRTKANLGDEDWTEALRSLREQYPNSADADMVPFIRVCKVRFVFGKGGGGGVGV
jgi:hypothetical protein